MFGSKGWFVFFLFMATGAIIGGMLGEAMMSSQVFGSGTSFLVQKYQVLNIPPVVIDFYVMKITVGFAFTPNLVAILGMIIALLLFNRI